MITFKQFLLEIERIQDKVFNNTTPTTLKRIAKHSSSGAARFVIDKQGKLHGGDGDNHLHDELAKPKDHHITGMVLHNKKKDTYHHQIYDAWHENGNDQLSRKQVQNHPQVKGMEDAGIKYKRGSVSEEAPAITKQALAKAWRK